MDTKEMKKLTEELHDKVGKLISIANVGMIETENERRFAYGVARDCEMLSVRIQQYIVKVEANNQTGGESVALRNAGKQR